MRSEPQNTAHRALAVEIEMMEQALRQVMVHVPTDECSIVAQADGSHALYARGCLMFTTKADLLAIEVTVESQCIHWPPPTLVHDEERVSPRRLAPVKNLQQFLQPAASFDFSDTTYIVDECKSYTAPELEKLVADVVPEHECECCADCCGCGSD